MAVTFDLNKLQKLYNETTNNKLKLTYKRLIEVEKAKLNTKAEDESVEVEKTKLKTRKNGGAKNNENKEILEVKKVEKPLLFKAVGLITCTVKKVDNRLALTIDNQDFPLLYIEKKAFFALKTQIKNYPKKPLTLRVYPKYNFLKNERRLSFILVGFDEPLIDGGKPTKIENDFLISGIWQFIPCWRKPLISVYRNKTEQVENILNACVDELETKRLLRTNHLTVNWKTNIPPYRSVKPTEEKTEQPQKYFVSVRCRFNPETHLFDVIEELNKPTLKIPEYIKIKKNKK